MARVVRYYTARDGDGVDRRYPVVYAERDEFWTAPRMWEGSTCFILGGGPSLHETDLSGIKGRCVIGVNDAYSLGSWIHVCAFGDYGWFETHDRSIIRRSDGTVHPGLREYGGLIVAFCKQILTLGRTDIRVMKTQPNRFRPEPYCVGWNSNTGIASVNLALHFGAKRIVLLGFDMHSKDGRTNWHDNLRHVEKKDFKPNYKHWLRNIRYCEKSRKKNWPDVEILNATPDSAIPHKIWPHVSLEDVLARESQGQIADSLKKDSFTGV